MQSSPFRFSEMFILIIILSLLSQKICRIFFLQLPVWSQSKLNMCLLSIFTKFYLSILSSSLIVDAKEMNEVYVLFIKNHSDLIWPKFQLVSHYNKLFFDIHGKGLLLLQKNNGNLVSFYSFQFKKKKRPSFYRILGLENSNWWAGPIVAVVLLTVK